MAGGPNPYLGLKKASLVLVQGILRAISVPAMHLSGIVRPFQEPMRARGCQVFPCAEDRGEVSGWTHFKWNSSAKGSRAR
jgi:hypothetical protein